VNTSRRFPRLGPDPGYHATPRRGARRAASTARSAVRLDRVVCVAVLLALPNSVFPAPRGRVKASRQRRVLILVCAKNRASPDFRVAEEYTCQLIPPLFSSRVLAPGSVRGRGAHVLADHNPPPSNVPQDYAIIVHVPEL